MDSLAPGFGEACAAAAAHGFAAVVRPAGGRLAAYHNGALVLDLVAPHPEPRAAHRQRFATAATALVDGLRMLGVDARPGPVPGEYCPGDYSVNARGATKLVGTAQRITRHGYLFSAVVLPLIRSRSGPSSPTPIPCWGWTGTRRRSGRWPTTFPASPSTRSPPSWRPAS